MSLKKMLTRGRVTNPGLTRQLAVGLIQDGCQDWTPEGLSHLIATGEVPQVWIQHTVQHILNEPTLFSVEKPEFLRAAQIARPDLAQLLMTPAGDAWLERAMWQLGQALVVKTATGWLTGWHR